MKHLAAILLAGLGLASASFAQTVQNPSFETSSTTLTLGNYNSGPIPSWPATGMAGSWQPNSAAFTSTCDGPTVVWVEGTITQDVGVPLAPNTIYTLSVCTGRRAGGADDSASWVISLLAGSAQVASNTGPNSSIPIGTFAKQTLTFTTGATVPSGDLIISLSRTGREAVFDAVALTSAPTTPPPPPKFQTLTFGVQLVNCTKCDGTDYAPLASASIYQGASFALTQDGQDICAATLNSSAQASCTGAVNVTPAIVNLTYQVNSPSGALLAGSNTAQFPSLLATGASTGNVILIVGFDASTMTPRAVQLYTQ